MYENLPKNTLNSGTMSRLRLLCSDCGYDGVSSNGDNPAQTCPECGKHDLTLHVPPRRTATMEIPKPPPPPSDAAPLRNPHLKHRLGHFPDELRITLDILEGNHQGNTYEIRQARTTFGRGEVNIDLHDSRVSRNHMVFLVFDDEKIMVCDLVSTNGVFVNGKRIQQHFLCDGDRVMVGKTRLRLHVERRH